MFFLVFLVLLMFFVVFASISLGKIKKIQALVKFYMFLIQKFECTPYFWTKTRPPNSWKIWPKFDQTSNTAVKVCPWASEMSYPFISILLPTWLSLLFTWLSEVSEGVQMFLRVCLNSSFVFFSCLFFSQLYVAFTRRPSSDYNCDHLCKIWPGQALVESRLSSSPTDLRLQRTTKSVMDV